MNNSSSVAERERDVETHFFGLFDGHAGGRCSNHIASCLGNVIAEDNSFVSNLPQALKRSFHVANEQFLKIAEKMKYHDGSTGLVAIVRDRKVLVANVGDCRALIVSNGRPIQMSIDQKPTSPDEQKRIAALGGTVVYCMGVARVNRVLAVSRAFGNRTLRSVIRPDAEMMQRELTKDDDYLVMASDGLWDVLKNKDVCDICYSPFVKDNPQAIADELVQTALLRGSMDNVTCICVKLNGYVQRMMNAAASDDQGGGAGVGAGAGAMSRQQSSSGMNRSPSLRGLGRTPDSSSGSTGYAELMRSRSGTSSLGGNDNSASNMSTSNSAIYSMQNKQMSLNSINSESDSTGGGKSKQQQQQQQQHPYPMLRMATTHFPNSSDSEADMNRPRMNSEGDSAQSMLPSAGSAMAGGSGEQQQRRTAGEQDPGTVYSPGGLFTMSPTGPKRWDQSKDVTDEDFVIEDEDDNETLVLPNPSSSKGSSRSSAAAQGQSSSGYAARRANATSVGSSTSARASAMPNLISMFGNSSGSVAAGGAPSDSPRDRGAGRSGGSGKFGESNSDPQQHSSSGPSLFSSSSRRSSRK